MKQKKRIVGFVFILTVFITIHFAQAQAQNFKDTLSQYVADLQKNPNDQTLREKIIKLAQEMKLAPKIPNEVDELIGKATYIFKNAKSEAEFNDAVDAYQKALLIAPWVAEYYYNLGAVQEKAGKLKEAVNSLNLYLLAAPEAKDAKEVREHIGGLKYAAEKAMKESSPEAVAVKKQDDYEVWLKNLDGARFIGPPIQNEAIGYEGAFMYLVYYIEGNKVYGGWFDREPADFKMASIRGVEFIDGSRSVWSLDIQGRQFSIPQPSFQDFRYDTATISDDGQFITFVHNKFVMKRVK